MQHRSVEQITGEADVLPLASLSPAATRRQARPRTANEALWRGYRWPPASRSRSSTFAFSS
jgi:hypothetical protein